MDKRKYFTDLISLYEAVGMTGAEEVVPQEEIADSGEDVGPENPNEAPVENDNENLDMDFTSLNLKKAELEAERMIVDLYKQEGMSQKDVELLVEKINQGKLQ